jgi:hypothetical protein
VSAPTTTLTWRQRRTLATVPWRFVVWLLLLGISWDAGSLFFTGSTTTYRGPGYFWLRQMPGGMRTYGVVLGVLALATIYAFGKSTESRQSLFLRICLMLLVVWYTVWTGGLLVGWETSHDWTGAGALGRTLAFAGMCCLAAHYTPKG